MDRQNIPLDKIEEIKLFYNDIKYVTRSLTKDSEALCSCLLASTKRHHLKEPRAIEAFMKKEEKRLEEIKFAFHKLIKIEKKGQKKFAIHGWKSFDELERVLKDYETIRKEMYPADTWFSTKNYDAIQDMMDEVQTKIEDSARAKERIEKVWSEEVFQAHNVRFTREYVEILGGSRKYLNANYWRYRKHLKKLFIEDESLYTEEEVKLLCKNVAILEENDSWIFFSKRKIKEQLGENYKGKETDWVELRTYYDCFYSWLLKQPEDCKVTGDNYEEFCDYLAMLRTISVDEYLEMVNAYIPFFQKEDLTRLTFEQIEQQIGDYQYALKVIKQHYGISYLSGSKENYCLDSMSKLVARVVEKKKWLQEKKDQIDQYFGGVYQGTSTNWDEMRECILESGEEINGILLRRIKQYGFTIMKDIEEDLEAGSYAQAAKIIVEGKASMPLEELVKRCAKATGQKRVTAKVKQEIQCSILESLSEQYLIEDDFVIVKNQNNMVFQIPSDQKKRAIEQIALPELQSGVLRVIEVEEEITLDNLTKLFAKLLGYPRRTKVLSEQLETAVKRLKQDGKIVRNSGGWSILEE
ncbi:MAG: hypothetical protein IKL07_08540 [Clostridium sp.]|nr:hypothetical protein [Clostridium sp.]